MANQTGILACTGLGVPYVNAQEQAEAAERCPVSGYRPTDTSIAPRVARHVHICDLAERLLVDDVRLRRDS